jgi:hypothetical protein
MSSFPELAASRKAWINEALITWCRTASRADLLKAEEDWVNIAGRVAPERSLWLWAWSRFPCLFLEGLGGLEETWPVRVIDRHGRTAEGYPDNRNSARGELQILGDDGTAERFVIDDVTSVERI